MSFYKELSKCMEARLSDKQLKLLPRSYQVLGKVLVVKLKPGLLRKKKLIADEILKMFPHLDTVCIDRGISGVRRKPKVDVYGGPTETVHKEHGCLYMMDVKDVMFSKGNKSEKMRIAKMVKKSETIVDMFAGIGYWTIPIAVKKKPKKIYAMEINPKAADFLEKNAWINGTAGKIKILRGDNRKFAFSLKGVADRVIMGYLKGTEKFLPFAILMGKKNFIIHYHDILNEDRLPNAKKKLIRLGKKYKSKITVSKVKKIKSYSPGINHYVFDLKVRRL